MKIQRVLLRDIRCFHQLEITLGGQSALIVGDNGDGKSTFLRSLAMGLCDDSSAAALFRDLHGESVRKGSKGGRIEVNLRDGRRDVRTVTEIKSLKTFERVEQTLFQQNLRNKRFRKLSQRTFPWNRIFAAGYGAGIRVQGTADYDRYSTVDAVYPLSAVVGDVPIRVFCRSKCQRTISERSYVTISTTANPAFTMRTAAAVPDRIGAAASFHGGGLVTDQADSPHLLVPKMKAHYLFAIAENDDENQPDTKDVLRDAFAQAGLPAEIEVYAGAMHGWCPPDSTVYHEAQAERAWSRLLALFENALA